MSVLFIGDLLVRRVRTRDDYVRGIITKYEVVEFDNFDTLIPLSSHYTEDEAYREAAALAASL